jgi:transcription antitermination factor NusA-like protein
LAGDLRREMPKHKPEKKESESTNFNEGDLSSNGERNEIKQENFQVDELAGAASKKEAKNIFNYIYWIFLSGLAAAIFGLGAALFINNYYPEFLKNESQIAFEQNMQVRLKELSDSIKQLEIDLIEANKKSENFISEKELAINLSQIENKIIKNKEEFDLKYLKFGDLKKQLETKFSNMVSRDTEVRLIANDTLQKKQEEVTSNQEISGAAKNNSEKRLKTEYLINEDLRAIQNSTIYGNTFEKNLKNIEFFLDMKAPVILKNVSETGIPTMKNLSESFPKFARLALTADRNEQETANFKILTFLKSQFQARSTKPRQGPETDAVLSRSEAFLKSNELEKSLFELTQLDDTALKVMKPWRTAAEKRIEALLAVEQLVQSIEE